MLAEIHKALFEQPVAVAQPVARQGDIVGHGAVQEAGGQTAQSPVAEGVVLDVL